MAPSVIASEVPPARWGGLTPRRKGAGPAGQGEGDTDTGRTGSQKPNQGSGDSTEAVMTWSEGTGSQGGQKLDNPLHKFYLWLLQ